MEEILRFIKQAPVNHIVFYKPKGKWRGYAVYYDPDSKQKPLHVFKINSVRKRSSGGLTLGRGNKDGEVKWGVPRIVKWNFAQAIKTNTPVFLANLAADIPQHGPVHVVNVRKYRCN